MPITVGNKISSKQRHGELRKQSERKKQREHRRGAKSARDGWGRKGLMPPKQSFPEWSLLQQFDGDEPKSAGLVEISNLFLCVFCRW